MYSALKNKLETLDFRLNPPVEAKALNVHIEQLGISLPESLRELYQHFNGAQRSYAITEEHTAIEKWLAVEEIAAEYTKLRQELETIFGDITKRRPYPANHAPEDIQNTYLDPHWLPLFTTTGYTTCCIDLNPGTQGQHGQILLIDRIDDEEPVSVIADSLEDWIRNDWLSETPEDTEELTSIIKNLGQEMGIFDEYGELIDQPADIDSNNHELIEHVQTHIGDIDASFSSDASNLRIHITAPNEHAPYWLLFSDGISQPAASADTGAQNYELCIILPEDWQIDNDADIHQWPLHLLINISSWAYTNQIPLDVGAYIYHPAPDDDPLPGTDFHGVLILPPVTPPEAFRWLKKSDGRTIQMLTLIPLYTSELEYIEQHDVESLFPHLERIELTDIIDIHRPNSIPNNHDQPH